LIADDSDPLRRSLREAIESNPAWQVCGEAVNGAEAVEMAKKLNPDLVILDLAMPVMNGLDAAERLSWEMPHVPLLLCTLYATNGLVPHARMVGVSGLISKAAGLDGNLTAAIRAVADGKQFFPTGLDDED
jgi:DNA-binding NarL/FixJ family response regulator